MRAVLWQIALLSQLPPRTNSCYKCIVSALNILQLPVQAEFCVHTEGWAIFSRAIKFSPIHFLVPMPLNACYSLNRWQKELVPVHCYAQPVFARQKP